MIKVRNYKTHLLKQLKKSEEAAAYLNAALLEEDSHAFLLALRDIAEAQGGMSYLAKETELNRENLYRTFSLRGNPRFFNLMAILDVFGLEFSIHAKKETEKS